MSHDKMVTVTVYMTPEQKLKLDFLHAATRIPRGVLIRDGIDKVLQRELPQYGAQLELPFGRD